MTIHFILPAAVLSVILAACLIDGPPFLERRKMFGLREQVRELASNVGVERAKRRQLIDQLVAVVTEHARHERAVHLGVSDAMYSPHVAGLAFVLSATQRFPELKANQSYAQLSSELAKIEASLQEKVEQHNEAVRIHNIQRVQLPAFYKMRDEFPEVPYDREFDQASPGA